MGMNQPPPTGAPTPAAPAPSGPPPQAALRARRAAMMRGGATWFFFIAALTLVNTVLFFMNSDRRFVIGTGITDVANFIGANDITGSAGTIAAGVFDAVVIAGFVGLGLLARRGTSWAFLVGMIVYALDALLLAWLTDWLSVVFHALALFYLFRGFQASRELAVAAGPPSIPPTPTTGIAPPITPR